MILLKVILNAFKSVIQKMEFVFLGMWKYSNNMINKTFINFVDY